MMQRFYEWRTPCEMIAMTVKTVLRKGPLSRPGFQEVPNVYMPSPLAAFPNAERGRMEEGAEGKLWPAGPACAESGRWIAPALLPFSAHPVLRRTNDGGTPSRCFHREQGCSEELPQDEADRALDADAWADCESRHPI